MQSHWQIILPALLLATSISQSAQAKKSVPAKVNQKTSAISEDPRLHERFLGLKQRYLQGELSQPAAWAELSWFHDRGARLNRTDRVTLLETQSVMLDEAGYPILAAIYASQAIKLAINPLAPELDPAWAIMRRVSEKEPIQSVLEIVADGVDLKGGKVPVFGDDWNYVAGNAAARRGDVEQALGLYGRVNVDGRYFFPAKYQQAMLEIDREKPEAAESALKAILFPVSHKMSPLAESSRRALVDYSYLALGRLYYETKRFAEAAKMYRAVSKEGQNFYDAQFEQAWAFFMDGYPMHALGALHAVESPFYQEVANPEAQVLRAMIHYWLCRYDDSRNALADFTERYEPQIKKLNDFLGRQRLDPDIAYNLFENLVSGVSEESLALPRSFLKTAAERDSLLLVRDQYASILEEKNLLEGRGIFGDKAHLAKPLDYLSRWATALKKDIGKRFLAELHDIKADYDRLYSQAQFLYVELLMSEKDHLLGKELHGDSKITRVEKTMQVKGWGDKTQAWKQSRHGEYWWDEVGYYIVPVEPLCTATPTVAH